MCCVYVHAGECVLILDFDGVIVDTLDEDLLCVYHILRGTGYIEDMGDISPTELHASGLLDTEPIRLMADVRPYIRAAEDYFAFLKGYLDGIEMDPIHPGSIFTQEEINRFRSDWYRVRSRLKSMDLEGWKGLQRPYDGIGAVLRHARDKGWTLAIATGRSRASTTELLGHMGLSDYFTTMRFRDDNMDKRGMIQSIRNELSADTVIFVDDSIDNLVNVGTNARPVLALWGYTQPENEVASKAASLEDLVECKKPLDLLELLD